MNPVAVDYREIDVQKELSFAMWYALEQTLPGCSTILDIGANVGGMFPMLLSKGAKKIHAFEPFPPAYAKLVDAWDGDNRIVPNNVGVSNVPGRVTGAKIYNAWTLLPEGKYRIGLAIDHAKDPAFDFDLITVDDYVAKHNLKVDFIKLDVDGYELRVLKGAVNTLAKFRPPMVYELSFMPSLIGDNCEEMCKLIFELGYFVVTMDGNKVVKDWITLIERFPWRSSFDVMLIPKEKL